MKRALFYSAAAILAVLFVKQPLGASPVELGDVKWGRKYEATRNAAKESGKPVLILFQEVPG